MTKDLKDTWISKGNNYMISVGEVIVKPFPKVDFSAIYSVNFDIKNYAEDK